jgi:hypothetical protein
MLFDVGFGLRQVDFVERQQLMIKERKERLEEKRRLQREEHGPRQPQLSRRSMELASKRREIEAAIPSSKPRMGERSKQIIAGSANKRVREPSLTRLARRTSSHERRMQHGTKKEVIVYRGWSRHVEYVPIDEEGRPTAKLKGEIPSVSEALLEQEAGRRESEPGLRATQSVPVPERAATAARGNVGRKGKEAAIEAELHIAKLGLRARPPPHPACRS